MIRTKITLRQKDKPSITKKYRMSQNETGYLITERDTINQNLVSHKLIYTDNGIELISESVYGFVYAIPPIILVCNEDDRIVRF